MSESLPEVYLARRGRLTGDSGIQAMERADGLDSLATLRQER